MRAYWAIPVIVTVLIFGLIQLVPTAHSQTPSPIADLALTLNARSQVPTDQTVQFELSISNLGPHTATNVEVTVSLPPELTLLGIGIDSGQGQQCTSFPCNLGNLQPFQQDVFITVIASINEGTLGGVTATASVTSTPFSSQSGSTPITSTDPDASNNQVQTTLPSRKKSTSPLWGRNNPW